MERHHCDHCGALVDIFDKRSIAGTVDVRRQRWKWPSGWHKAQVGGRYSEGAWCSIECFMAWLVRCLGLKDDPAPVLERILITTIEEK